MIRTIEIAIGLAVVWLVLSVPIWVISQPTALVVGIMLLGPCFIVIGILACAVALDLIRGGEDDPG